MINDPGYIAVEHLYNSHKINYDYLMINQQVSFATDYKSQFSKIMLLACASYFESLVTSSIHQMLNPSDCILTKNFITSKALSRQYHSLFSWEAKNANQFFSYFGLDFKSFMDEKVKNDDNLKRSIHDFLELGYLRNRLAHDNYAMFTLGLTADDVHAKFLNALIFVSNLTSYCAEYRNTH